MTPGFLPVRLPATFEPTIVRDDCLLDADHPLYGQPCPACMEPIGADRLPVALVAIGVPPASRKADGYATGAAVAVHTACARPPMSPEAGRALPVLVTAHDQISGSIRQRRIPLDDYTIVPTGMCAVVQKDVFPNSGTHVITLNGVRQPREEEPRG